MHKLCCRGPRDREWRWRREGLSPKSVQSTEALRDFQGFSSLSPRLRLALSLRTIQAGILALYDASRDSMHQGLGTGVQVRPPSLVSRLLVFRAFQMVAWSASVARTPPRSSASGDGMTFQWVPPSVVRRMAPTRPTIQHT